MTFLGFDPGALLCGAGEDELVEATLTPVANRLLLTLERENGDEMTLHLRGDFLDALIAARTREAAA